MRETREILAGYRLLCEREAKGVLATVIHTVGSTYRKPGARMLMGPDGSAVGLVGGGCLEDDLLQRAREVRERGRPTVVRYDSRRHGDLLWGLGLGCAGFAEIYLEPVDRASPGPLRWLAEWLDAGRAGALATVVRGADIGRRIALHSDGRLVSSDGAVPDPVREALARALSSQQSGLVGDRFIEFVPPALRLAIFGAGIDAEPLARFAVALGWDVVVADHRPAYAKPERFPGSRVVLAQRGRVVGAVGVCERTHAVVMSHNFESDLAVLSALLESPVAYVALLGPRARAEGLLSEIASGALAVDPRALARVFAPAGLDIGAETPEEIALAIVAEIQAVSRSRSAGSLRARSGPIHPDAAR